MTIDEELMDGEGSGQQPKVLWHYTDATGLLGIVGGSDAGLRFRATAIEYLNDHQELLYGLTYLKTRILNLAEKVGATVYRDDEPHLIVNISGKVNFLKAICETIDQVAQREYPIHIHCYVTSFTAAAGSLSPMARVWPRNRRIRNRHRLKCSASGHRASVAAGRATCGGSLRSLESSTELHIGPAQPA